MRKSFFVLSLSVFFLPVLRLSAGTGNTSIFQKATPPENIIRQAGQKISAISWFAADEQALERLRRDKPPFFSLSIPGPEGEWILDLEKTSIASPKLRVRTSGQQLYSGEIARSVCYRGTVRGKKASLASLTISGDELSGLFSFGEGNYNLTKLRLPGQNYYALFNDRAIREQNPFQCHTEDLAPSFNRPLNKAASPGTTTVQSGNCRRVEIFFECDHQMFLDQGGTTGTVNFVESLFNVIAAIYAQEGINIRISEIFVHDQPDNYPSATSFEALDAFRDSIIIRPPSSGNLAHLLSTLPRANGGVAYLNALCTEGSGFNIGYSNIYNSFLPLPYYSWNVNVVAHELGHNFGSPHTQSCSWEISPGVFGMLDSCYTAEGDCYSGPRIASVGTMMSYCHLMNLGIDLSKGFGPAPGELIRVNYHSASCLSGLVELPPLSISPSDTICNGSSISLSVTPVDGAAYQWNGPNGFSAATSSVTVPNAGSANAGLYSVTVSKDGCDASPLSTRIEVDCINTIPQTNRFPCRAGSFTVDFVASFQPLPQNEFIVEISDAQGSFTNPRSVGSLQSSTARGSIAVTLPAQLPVDSGYLLRIRSTQPATIGQASLQKLTVLPLRPPLSVQDAKRCGPGSLNLQVLSNDSVFWYASENAADPIAQGSFFQTPSIDTSTNFWVESRRFLASTVGPPAVLTADTLSVANTYHGIFIRVKKSIVLDQLTVFSRGPGMLKLNIKDSANTFTYKTISSYVEGLPEGDKMNPAVELGPGIYRLDAQNSTVPGLIRLNNFFSFPMTSEGMDITGSSVPGRYYFFFDLQYRIADCPDERKKVKAEILPIPDAPLAFDASRCGPGKLVLRASGAAAGQSYRWYNSSAVVPIPGENTDSLVVPSQTVTGNYFASVIANGLCESNLTLAKAIVYEQPANPVIMQEGPLLLASPDTLFAWYRNGVFLGVFGDTLNAESYGSGQYQAILVTENNCRAASNVLSIFFTDAFSKGRLKPVRIYPNPVQGMMQIQLPDKGNFHFQCLDVSGRKIKEFRLTESGQVDVRELSAGTYILFGMEEGTGKTDRTLWIKD